MRSLPQQWKHRRKVLHPQFTTFKIKIWQCAGATPEEAVKHAIDGNNKEEEEEEDDIRVSKEEVEAAMAAQRRGKYCISRFPDIHIVIFSGATLEEAIEVALGEEGSGWKSNKKSE